MLIWLIKLFFEWINVFLQLSFIFNYGRNQTKFLRLKSVNLLKVGILCQLIILAKLCIQDTSFFQCILRFETNRIEIILIYVHLSIF